jgi:hypothetical protein
MTFLFTNHLLCYHLFDVCVLPQIVLTSMKEQLQYYFLFVSDSSHDLGSSNRTFHLLLQSLIFLPLPVPTFSATRNRIPTLSSRNPNESSEPHVSTPCDTYHDPEYSTGRFHLLYKFSIQPSIGWANDRDMTH